MVFTLKIVHVYVLLYFLMIHLTWHGNVTIVRGLSSVPQGPNASNWKNTSKYPKRATTACTTSSTTRSTDTLSACPIVPPRASRSVEDVASADAYCFDDDLTSADAYWINDDVSLAEVKWIEV